MSSEERFLELVRGCVPGFDGTVNWPARLREDLGFDSLSVVELVIRMECEFSIEIPPDEMDLANFATVESSYALARRCMRDR